MTRRVLLGTPTMNFMVDAYYAFSCEQALRLCLANDIDLRTLRPSGSSVLPDTRNEILHAAYAHGFDDLIWVDADNSFPAEWFLKLLSYPVDCVGGVYRKKTDDAEAYTVRIPGGVSNILVDEDTGLWTAPGLSLGCGFLRLSRRAVVALWESAEKYLAFERTEKFPWVFEFKLVDGHLIGEDTILSDKLAALDIPTWVDPAMTCGHFGAKNYSGDFLSYIRRRLTQQQRAPQSGA